MVGTRSLSSGARSRDPVALPTLRTTKQNHISLLAGLPQPDPLNNLDNPIVIIRLVIGDVVSQLRHHPLEILAISGFLPFGRADGVGEFTGEATATDITGFGHRRGLDQAHGAG